MKNKKLNAKKKKVNRNMSDIFKEKLEKNIFFTVMSIFLIFLFIDFYLIYLNLDKPQSVNLLFLLPFIFILAPYFLYYFFKSYFIQKKILQVPRFLKDIYNEMDSGLEFISAIKALKKNNYFFLGQDIAKLNNMLDWGIKVEDAILRFSKNIGDKKLYQDMILTIEARNIGSKIEKILKELAEKLEYENSRKKILEQNLFSNTLTSYISFGVFLIIIVLMFNSIFGGAGSEEVSIFLWKESTLLQLKSLMVILVYELSILSGFVFGVIQKEDLTAGFPHIIILCLMSFFTFFFFL